MYIIHSLPFILLPEWVSNGALGRHLTELQDGGVHALCINVRRNILVYVFLHAFQYNCRGAATSPCWLFFSETSPLFHTCICYFLLIGSDPFLFYTHQPAIIRIWYCCISSISCIVNYIILSIIIIWFIKLDFDSLKRGLSRLCRGSVCS